MYDKHDDGIKHPHRNHSLFVVVEPRICLLSDNPNKHTMRIGKIQAMLGEIRFPFCFVLCKLHYFIYAYDDMHNESNFV